MRGISASYLFGFDEPVRPRGYLLVGLLLAGLKYAGDLLLSALFASQLLDPLSFLSPISSQRLGALGEYPAWLPALMLLWAQPFIWIGVSMTARRAQNAQLSPWLSLLFFVPGLNFLLILLLCLARERPFAVATPRESAPSPPPRPPPLRNSKLARLRASLFASAVAAAFGTFATAFSALWLQQYGSALFLGSPFLLGLIAGVLYNRPYRQSREGTFSVAVLSVTVAGGVMLLLALEGALCLGMAAILAYPLAIIGATVGRALAAGPEAPPPSLLSLLVAWPLLALLPLLPGDTGERFPVRSAHTVLEIDAPPERVWPHVIAFPPLPPPSEWLLQTGVACPLSARIEGQGVGAIRYCEFTTGPFVEPITAWEPPHRLAFDVRAQPPSMREWSPYEVVHAPHLHGGVQSLRGEFRLVRLPGERTRLEGTTWFRVKMAPNAYWSLYAEQAIHVIHERVLAHIRTLSELPSKG